MAVSPRLAALGSGALGSGAGWWPVLLLFVFATHLPFFVWRWRRSRERRHAATSLTFVLLVATYALLVFAPQASVGDVPLFAILRRAAWASAALSLGLLARHHWRRRRSGVLPPQG